MSLGHLPLIITVCLYLVALYNCIRAIGNRTSSGATVAWILLQLTMPYVGVPLYFLLGDFRIRGYVKRHRAAQKQLGDSGGLLPFATSLPPEDFPDAIRPTYGAFRQVFGRFGGVFEPQVGSVDLLVDGTETFKAIFAAIAAARRYIVVQYYIVRHDRLGLELKRLLIDKAKANIPVYMLFDDMGSFWLSRDYIRDLRRSGVKVEGFLPIASFKRVFQMNFRNHRKLVVVDGEVAFTGGLNVGEEYASRRSKKARRRYWRDTHVQVRGGVIAQLEDIFFEDWYFATGERIDLVALQLGNASIASTSLAPMASAPQYQTAVQVIPTGPTDEAVVSILFIMQMCNMAARRLWIATPYFVPDTAIIRALELAVLRGVDVRIMMPRVSDHRLVTWVSHSFGTQMQTHGVKVLLYGPGFMHQKVVLVDDTLAAVGTMNMDNRAMYLNFETMVLIHCQIFARKIASMLEDDFLKCRYLALPDNARLQWLHRMRGNTARLFAPLL